MNLVNYESLNLLRNNNHNNTQKGTFRVPLTKNQIKRKH